MLKQELNSLFKNWRTIAIILLIALFPLYRMNDYYINKTELYSNFTYQIDSLREDALKAQNSLVAIGAYTLNNYNKIESLLTSIADLADNFHAKEYNVAAKLYNDVSDMLESFQQDDQLRTFINDNMTIKTITKLDIPASFNVFGLDDTYPSSAYLFGDVGGFDYFYYFYTHNTYLIWVVVIVIKLMQIKRENQHQDKVSKLRVKFTAELIHIISCYLIGLGLFLLGIVIFKGIGNVDLMISYFSQAYSQTIRIPYYVLVLVQLVFHFLIFGLILAVNTFFTALSSNHILSIIMTSVVFFLLYLGVTSAIGSYDPLTYSDLLANIYSGTSTHFLDPTNQYLIKDTGSVIKGLIVILLPTIIVIELSSRIHSHKSQMR